MKVGFTGTGKGMTDRQKKTVTELLHSLSATELHHGDCVGADAEAHKIAFDGGLAIVVHPPVNDVKRANVAAVAGRVSVLTSKPYLERNHDIVDVVEVLIAAPLTAKRVLRSGTWATVRYGWKTGKRVLICNP